MRRQRSYTRQGKYVGIKNPRKVNTYVVALDPSMGTGGDNAAIQVFELPSIRTSCRMAT